jgi:hypothetical protein
MLPNCCGSELCFPGVCYIIPVSHEAKTKPSTSPDAEIEIFDFSTDCGKRRLSRVLRPADLPSVIEVELTAAMQLIADAYDDVMRMGIDWDALRQQRRDTATEWARQRDARKRDDQGDIFE